MHEYANEIIFITDHKKKHFINCITDDLKTCYGLSRKSVYLLWFFYDFPLISKVFINIHEYRNKIICIFDYGLKVLQSLFPFI